VDGEKGLSFLHTITNFVSHENPDRVFDHVGFAGSACAQCHRCLTHIPRPDFR
jgi:hypothetical protein